jgi:predicted ATPase
LRAAAQYLAAGREAISKSAVNEAVSQLSKGLSLLEQKEPSKERDLAEMRLQATIGTALMLSKGWAANEVQEAFLRASQLSTTADDPDEQVWILWGAWVSRLVHGRVKPGQEMCENILDFAQQSGTRRTVLVANMVALQQSFYSGNFKRACEHATACLDLFNPEEDRRFVHLYSTDLELVATLHLAIAQWVLGNEPAALQTLERAEIIARSIEHSYSLSWMLVWGATLPIMMGDFGQAGKMVEEGVTIARQHGYDYVVSLGKILQGYINFQVNEDPACITQMQDGLAAFLKTGSEIVHPMVRTLIASALSVLGKHTEALSHLDAAEDLIEEHGERWQLIDVLALRAEILERESPTNIEAILTAAQKAKTVLEAQNARGWLPRIAALGKA